MTTTTAPPREEQAAPVRGGKPRTKVQMSNAEDAMAMLGIAAAMLAAGRLLAGRERYRTMLRRSTRAGVGSALGLATTFLVAETVSPGSRPLSFVGLVDFCGEVGLAVGTGVYTTHLAAATVRW